jgi:hypothetical protein
MSTKKREVIWGGRIMGGLRLESACNPAAWNGGRGKA